MSKRPTNPELRHEIAVRFREAIEINGLTMSEAAAQLGVRRQTLWLYLNEKSMPGGEVLRKACQHWKLSLNIKGFGFTSAAFGPPKDKPQKVEQYDLFRALNQIEEKQIKTTVVRRVGEFVELRVRIKVAS
jgi:transcriptional regulator with XRE-family HTH domain